MKKIPLLLTLLVVALTAAALIGCSPRAENAQQTMVRPGTTPDTQGLRTRDARRAVDALLASNNAWGDGPYKVRVLDAKWNRLVMVNDRQARAKAVLTYAFVGRGELPRGHMEGSFVFRKSPNGNWILNRLDFTDGTNSIHEGVAQRVHPGNISG